MRFIYLIFILATSTLFSQSTKRNIEVLHRDYQLCIDRAISILDCSYDHYNQSDDLLNIVYHKIRKTLHPTQKEKLKEKQLAWIKSRDDYFKLVDEIKTDLSGEEDNVFKTQKRVAYVNQRILELDALLEKKKWINFKKSEILKFIPKDFTILDTISGDLNRDNYQDCILIVHNEKFENIDYTPENEEIRPLLLLLGNAKGELTAAASNNDVVRCHHCGGTFGEPYEGVTLYNGFFSVEHYGGSSWRWATKVTFSYSEQEKHWYLHKTELVNFNSGNPEEIEEKIKTKKDFGTVRFDAFNIFDIQY